jgi:hypothetical protein
MVRISTAIHEQVGGKRMPQCVYAGMLVNTREFQRLVEAALDG